MRPHWSNRSSSAFVVESHSLRRLQGLRLQIHLGTDICRVERDVIQPRTDGVGVDVGAQGMVAVVCRIVCRISNSVTSFYSGTSSLPDAVQVLRNVSLVRS